MNEQIVTTPETAVAPPLGTTRTHFEAEERLLRGEIEARTAETQTAAPVVEPAKVEAETPELEAASVKPDADLSEAARTLRRNRADERKAKIQLEISAAIREREELRAETDRLRRERDDLTRGPAPRPALVAAPAADPNDPKPDEGAYQDYSQFVADTARWAAREEGRRLQAEGRERIARQTSDQARLQTASTLEHQHESGRQTYSDFDAVVESVLAQLPERDPRRGDLAHFLESSEVGEHIVYRLGRDADAMKVVKAAPNAPALMRALRDVESTILAARKAPKPTTQAPAPPSQTVTTRQSPSSDVHTGNSTRDHFIREEAEIAERRKRGHRY